MRYKGFVKLEYRQTRPYALLAAYTGGKNKPAFPRLVESSGIFFVKFPGPGKSWIMILVLESPGICWDSDAMMRTQMRKDSCPYTSGFCDLFLQ